MESKRGWKDKVLWKRKNDFSRAAKSDADINFGQLMLIVKI